MGFAQRAICGERFGAKMHKRWQCINGRALTPMVKETRRSITHLSETRLSRFAFRKDDPFRCISQNKRPIWQQFADQYSSNRTERFSTDVPLLQAMLNIICAHSKSFDSGVIEFQIIKDQILRHRFNFVAFIDVESDEFLYSTNDPDRGPPDVATLIENILESMTGIRNESLVLIFVDVSNWSHSALNNEKMQYKAEFYGHSQEEGATGRPLLLRLLYLSPEVFYV